MQDNENTTFRCEYFAEVVSIALLLPFHLFFLFVFLMALWKVNEFWQLWLVVVVVFGAMSIDDMLSLLRFRKPILVLTQAGLEYPKMFGDERVKIHWEDIKNIELLRHITRKAYIYDLGIKIDAEPRQKNLQLVRGVPLRLARIKGDARAIHQDILRYWECYRNASN